MFGGAVAEEQERREAMRIQRRRERDEARRLRLLNARQRVLGVDKAQLDAQVQEKLARQRAQKEADRAYAASVSAVKDMLEVRRLEEKSNEYAEAMRTASAWDLQVKQARERTTFFLNDPDELKKDRVPGEAEACGPASMARFSGEDRSAGDRKRIQAAQLRNWCDQITQEKQAAKQQEREADMKHAQYLRQVDEIREQMVVQERSQRLRDSYQNASDNRRFAEMRRAEQQATLQQEKELNAMHNRTIMSDPMMLERRDQAISAIPGRVRRDHWKGMTVPQLEQIYATQQQQAQEKAVAAAKTAAEQQAYGDATNAVVDILQRQHEAERIRAAEDAMRVKQEQLVQAHEKRVRDVEMNKILNTNQVSDGFFNRFGASCR